MLDKLYHHDFICIPVLLQESISKKSKKILVIVKKLNGVSHKHSTSDTIWSKNLITKKHKSDIYFFPTPQQLLTLLAQPYGKIAKDFKITPTLPYMLHLHSCMHGFCVIILLLQSQASHTEQKVSPAVFQC